MMIPLMEQGMNSRAICLVSTAPIDRRRVTVSHIGRLPIELEDQELGLGLSSWVIMQGYTRPKKQSTSKPGSIAVSKSRSHRNSELVSLFRKQYYYSLYLTILNSSYHSRKSSKSKSHAISLVPFSHETAQSSPLQSNCS